MATSRTDLPDKLFFKIGEVTSIVGVKPHVLRYWETEFPRFIKPQKSKTNQRLYRRKDVETILAIRHLLYDLKYTIEGARKYLMDEGVETALPPEKPEALVDAAIRDARAVMTAEVALAKKQTRTHYEKKLLELQSELKTFIRTFSKDFR